ncbi:hypothetical protein B0I26_12224 [Anoxybacillus vitaminiphilus]|uniref:Uncharacterized protein n=1 Tax=Paranoxybacillus vitaminiphilus TaxID=581036 RepID=A0A327Y4X8_9BACL|nr:hypothetical protein [Anoxybacillus vitaminiphilus]RAK15332.1 hypothetical protein B0I26_12224 [Anoxybacillus vitaminiphilus]
MYPISPFNDSLFQYGNRQSAYRPSSLSLFPVTKVNAIAKQRKEYSFSQSKKAHKKAVFDEVLTELTGKGEHMNKYV